jgi:hypothetical protein
LSRAATAVISQRRQQYPDENTIGQVMGRYNHCDGATSAPGH